MPELAFISDPSPDQIRQIIGLYRAEKWWGKGPDDPDLVSRIVSGSHCFIIALEGTKIVGMGRAISDRSSDAYIQDVTVTSTHRGKGLGKEILRKLIDRLQSDGIGWIGLIAERNSHGFYKRLGFEQMPDSVPMLKIEL